MSQSSIPYRGRFAPSPTGPLHFGSLVGALCSYLDAKQHQGEWLLRIEDIDPLRVQADASRSILKSLEAHHLFWDGKETYQSQSKPYHEQTLAQLLQQKSIYPCPCSRRQFEASGGKHLNECEQRQVTYGLGTALRFNVPNLRGSFLDRFQGEITYTLNAGTDDFVVKRKEGFYAYQLAVVCDDIDQRITQVVRGIDLIKSTPLQLQLYHALNATPPGFGHFPVVVNSDGQKLSKQRLSPALDNHTALSNLIHAAHALQLLPQNEPAPDQIDALLVALARRWPRHELSGIKTLPTPTTPIS